MRVVVAALIGLLATSAQAQDWPTRPVTMIVPYAAGGPVDTVGRIMAQGLSEVLGQQVIVENVGGAGGMTGANRVAKGTPDGYTFLLGGSATMTTVPALYGKKVLYNSLTDFEHVIQFADSARILIARKDFPANTLKEFVAYAKSQHQQDPVRLIRRRRRRAHLCAAARSGDGREDHACAVPRLRTRDAGSARRAHRLHLRAGVDRDPADPRRHREGDRHDGPEPLRRAARPEDRRRGRLRHQLRVAQRVRISQRHARGDREQARRGDQQGGRACFGEGPLRDARRRGRAAGAAHARVLSQKPAAGAGAAGHGDEGRTASRPIERGGACC